MSHFPSIYQPQKPEAVSTPSWLTAQEKHRGKNPNPSAPSICDLRRTRLGYVAKDPCFYLSVPLSQVQKGNLRARSQAKHFRTYSGEAFLPAATGGHREPGSGRIQFLCQWGPWV